MLSQAPLPVKVAPHIMLTAATDPTVAPAISVPSTLGKKKRGRRARKANDIDIVGTTPKKHLLLDELGDALVNQYCASPKLEDRLGVSNASVVDHLRNNFTTALTVSSGASSRSSSSRTLTGFESTPATSLDDHEIRDTIPSPLPAIVCHHSLSSDNLQLDSPSRQYNNEQQSGVLSLDDFFTMTTIQRLTTRYGRVAHMGILDPSYRFFVNKTRTAALSYKIQNGVAVVAGDPLCETEEIASLLQEFKKYRRRNNLSIAFMGASKAFVEGYAQPQGWTAIRFGTERVLNPQTNDVLLERSGKRIAVQNRQLLNPHKGGVSLGVYVPAVHGTDTQLQADLVAIYDAWRAERNGSTGPQAFITVYDPFALPDLMTFVYTRGADGQINGFAALRRLQGGGYHIDPCIAAPGSPKGVSDLLLVAAMALLNRAGVSYLGFGFEPTHALGLDDISGMPNLLATFTRDLYSRTFQRLPIHGKKAYHDKFRPDPLQDSALYLVFPRSIPGPQHLLAMMHMANISLRKMIWADVRDWVPKRKKNSQEPTSDESVDKNNPVTTKG